MTASLQQVCCVALVGVALALAQARSEELPMRERPARSIPVPDTVSPEIRKLIAAPIPPTWNVIPGTADEWRRRVDGAAEAAMKSIPAVREALHVKSEPITLDGVGAFLLTPETIPPENRNRLLIHVHGGCYVLFPGESGTREAILMAGLGHFKVISVDYRMPPEHVYPAALDDVMIAWKAALKMADPHNMAVFGTSAGGALTLEMILRAKQENLPLPAAIAPGTPMSDLTGAGDSFQTNAMLDNVLVNGANCDKAAALYAAGHDLRDPMLSPIYGDMHGFPPTILTTGTRDLLLSNTVRVHRKLRQAGVEAVLQVFEGQSHAHYLYNVTAPETKEAFEEIARFFDRHLGK